METPTAIGVSQLAWKGRYDAALKMVVSWKPNGLPASERMKVVLDTNLFVAAYWNRSSASAKIIEMCLAGKIEAVCTQEIARELRMVIRTIRARPEYAARIQQFLEKVTYVNPVRIDMSTEDPEDQKFLECAAGAGAEYLITSDEHLLRMRSLGLSGIVKPSVFLKEIVGKT